MVQPPNPAVSCAKCLFKLGYGYDRISRLLFGSSAHKQRIAKWKKYHGWVRLFDASKAYITQLRRSLPQKPPTLTPTQRMLRSLERKSLAKRKVRLRTYLWKWTKHNLNPRLMPTIVGCSRPYFLHYIESKFSGAMSWANYGTLWHMDHIIPCSKFNLTIHSQVLKCFHFSNLQPLLAHHNKTKGASITDPQTNLLLDS